MPLLLDQSRKKQQELYLRCLSSICRPSSFLNHYYVHYEYNRVDRFLYKKSLKNTLKKIRERPQKIDDFEDDRMKVRFAFQQLLKKVILRDPSAAAKTPNEIFRQEYDGEEDFREYY